MPPDERGKIARRHLIQGRSASAPSDCRFIGIVISSHPRSKEREGFESAAGSLGSRILKRAGVPTLRVLR
jgi:hypothetical protein